jgi:hypothetical protein
MMEAFSCFLLDCIGALLSFKDNSFAAKGLMTQPVHVTCDTFSWKDVAGSMLSFEKCVNCKPSGCVFDNHDVSAGDGWGY